MPNVLDAPSRLVKELFIVMSNPLGLANILAVTTRPDIYTRIRELRVSRGRLESDRAFCRKLGLSESYLSQLKVQLKTDPGRTLEIGTATLIADELGMSVDELLGIERELREDKYPSRAKAVEAARVLQLAPDAISAAYALSPPNDPGWRWWFRVIESADAAAVNDATQVDRPSGQKGMPKLRLGS